MPKSLVSVQYRRTHIKVTGRIGLNFRLPQRIGGFKTCILTSVCFFGETVPCPQWSAKMRSTDGLATRQLVPNAIM